MSTEHDDTFTFFETHEHSNETNPQMNLWAAFEEHEPITLSDLMRFAIAAISSRAIIMPTLIGNYLSAMTVTTSFSASIWRSRRLFNECKLTV